MASAKGGRSGQDKRRVLLLAGGAVVFLGALLALVPRVASTARSWATPSTPLDTGNEGFVPRDDTGKPDHTTPNGARILAEQELSPDKRIVLYAWRARGSAPPSELSVIPLGITKTRSRLLPRQPRVGWHPAGVAGRWGAIPNGTGFVAGSLPAGFGGTGEAVATAWGLSARGVEVRVTWSDGAVTLAPLWEQAFLQVRADPNYPQRLNQRLHVRRMEVLDERGTVLATQDLPASVIPEVRSP